MNGVRVDPEKIAIIRDWPQPTSVKGVQSFLGFCNFYRKFIEGYSRIAKPLHGLTKKGNAWAWTPECEEAFQKLRRN